jgi:predicted Ser/Thr protein kinase
MPKRKPTDIVSLKIRFTEAMRTRIEQEAKKANRSLNGEMVYRLGLTFGAEGVELANQFEEAEKEMMKAVREAMQRILADTKAKKG